MGSQTTTPTMIERTCDNCAWSVLYGEDNFCIASYARKNSSNFVGLCCIDENDEIWCTEWNKLTDSARRLRKEWIQCNRQQIIDQHWKSLVGPPEQLGRD